ncbi:MAG TPA: hypothetical protein VFJ16_24800 [Longimicrobium sp.]|nr:hypothetical protein [Longimicrobium sp.]
MIPTDIGAYITSRSCGGVAVTAGGAGDNTEVNGPWVDRQGYASAKLVITFKAVLAAAATLTIAANLQEATDSAGTGAADFGAAHAAATAATGAGGGSTEYGVVELDLNLTTAERYVRAQFTPNLSAANTDTAVVSAVLVLGGGTNIPAV